jgi:Uma2 family endonuclease
MFPYLRTGPFAHVGQITVAEFHRMIDDGVFDTEEKERCELIEGWIVPKACQSPGHCYVREMLADWFRARELPPGWMYSQVTTVVTTDSHPDPDGCVVRDEWMAKPCRYPRADEVVIVMEVADVSLDFDRTIKQRVYARAGIPVYWLVNLVDQQIEVYTNAESPAGGEPHYRTRTDYRPGQQVPLVIAGTAVGSVAVSDLLP